jgi:hypothetical protein
VTADLLARLRGVFVEPSPAAAGRAAAPVAAAPPAAGLLCRPGDALALGSAVALSLRPGARAGLVAVWRPHGGPSSPALRAPPTRHARRLAASLSARGLDASASGRLARVKLPEPPPEAAAAAERALAAAQAPAVLVVAGPRCAALDAVLATLDRLLVAAAPGEDPALARLAADGLARLGPPADLVAGLGSPLVRALAGYGLLAPPRAVLAPVVPVEASPMS